MKLRVVLMAAVACVTMAATANAVSVTGQISLNGFAQAVGSTAMGAVTGISFANASGTSVTDTSLRKNPDQNRSALPRTAIVESVFTRRRLRQCRIEQDKVWAERHSDGAAHTGGLNIQRCYRAQLEL